MKTNLPLQKQLAAEHGEPVASRRLRFGWIRAILTARSGQFLLVLLFVLLVPISNPRVYAVDEVGYYVYLRSIYFDHDLDFENEYRTLDALNPRSGIAAALLKPGPIKDGGRRNEVTGLYGNVAPVGAALFWSPFYVAADIGVRTANALGARVPADGYSKPYVWAVCYASALYGLLGLLLCHRLALRFVSPFAATLATATVWLASPLVFYMFVQMPWSHATGFFAVSCFLVFWYNTRSNRRLRDWFVLGVLGGLMTLVREQLILFMLLPAIEAVWLLIGAGRRQETGDRRQETGDRQSFTSHVSRFTSHVSRLLPGYGLCGVALILTLLPQLLVYQVLNGAMRPNTEVSGKFRDTWYSPCFFHTLVDPSPCLRSPGGAFSHGALLWSPVLAIGICGLLLLWQRDRLLAMALTAALLAQMFVNGSIYTWHQSGAFGFRRFIECTPIFLLGLALVIERWVKVEPATQRSSRAYIATCIVALLLVCWNVGLIFNWTVGHTELRRGLDWRYLVGWQLDVPRQATTKIGTLLFDRCKLYDNQGCVP